MDLAKLDFKKLRIFNLVAKFGGLRPAALRLRMTVSGVSFNIRRLEEQLKVDLFRRTPNRLVLTPSGRRLAETTETLLSALENILSASALEELHPDRVSISVNSDLAWYFVPRISSFLKQYPSVELGMSIKNSADALRSVEAGETDMGIGLFGEVPSSIEIAPILKTTLTLTYLNGHPLASLKQIRVEDLAKYKVLVAGSSSARIGRTKWAMHGLIEAGNCQTACDLVEAGVGVGLIHTFCACRAQSGRFEFRDLGRLFGDRTFSAIFRKQPDTGPILLTRLKDALLDEA